MNEIKIQRFVTFAACLFFGAIGASGLYLVVASALEETIQVKGTVIGYQESHSGRVGHVSLVKYVVDQHSFTEALEFKNPPLIGEVVNLEIDENSYHPRGRFHVGLLFFSLAFFLPCILLFLKSREKSISEKLSKKIFVNGSFLLLGSIFFIPGMMLTLRTKDFKDHSAEVPARVVFKKFPLKRSSGEIIEASFEMVEYEYQGVSYQRHVAAANNWVGGGVITEIVYKLLVDKRDPKIYRHEQDSEKTIGHVFAIVGGLVMLIGVFIPASKFSRIR